MTATTTARAGAAARADGPVLVLLDTLDGALTAPTLELLTLAREIGPDAPAHAVWLGDGAEDALEDLGAYGVGTVHVPELAGRDRHGAAVAAESLRAVVLAAAPSAVLLVSTFQNKEVAARLAVLLGSGLVVDGARLTRAEDDALVVDKTVFAGTWSTRCRVTTGTPLIAMKPHSTQAAPVAQPVQPDVVRVSVDFTAAASAVRVLERTDRHVAGGRPDLAESQVVVAGGRGTEGDFTLVERLADVLGGAVGATRVATDEGWIDHSAQIGQTGVTIAPRLYIGAGISGAVHHRGGMQASEHVVAVNTDPDAPIFEFADFGVVGDLNEVIPQAIEEIRRRRGE